MIRQASLGTTKAGQELQQSYRMHSIRAALHEREGRFRPWLKRGVEIDKAYSDRELKTRWAAMTEALTLVWLADCA